LGQTPLDIIIPLAEWFTAAKGGSETVPSDVLIVGDKMFKKKTADEVSWL